jgi:hypothetical protein
VEADFALTAGILCILLSMPAFVSAFSGSRTMRLPVTLLIVGGLLVTWATSLSGTTYRSDEVPQAVLRVLAYFFR